MSFIGRQYEEKLIQIQMGSNKAQLGVIYGRRRIGKSTLLKKGMKSKGDLYFEGLQKASTQKQIDHFMEQLAEQTHSLQIVANNWKDAFNALSKVIITGQHYVVFDEFPWMASGLTNLVSLLKYYWDNSWKNNPKLTLILCGSIAQFMQKHILHSQALHNRKTFEIKLEALPAKEAKLFFKNYRSSFEILKFLMVFGGVPKYLEQIDPKKSLFQNIDNLCFQKNCFFLNEFETLFKEQFKVTKTYESIVKILSKKSCTKEDLATALHQKSGGGLTQYIHNLELADFVKSFRPTFMHSEANRTQRIYLFDEWLKFYFTYMQPHLNLIALNKTNGFFESLAAKSFDTYCGLAFERLCLKNIDTIVAAMGIPLSQIQSFGPYFRQGSRAIKTKKQGLQIDILMERKGHILTVIECKFSPEPIGSSIKKDIEAKLALLRAPKTYTVEKVLIAPGGVTADLEQSGYFHKILGCEAVLG